MIGLWITLGVVGILIIWLMLTFNSMKRKQIAVDQAWSDVDVQLKRRYDLIPNLVNTVKGYASHEKDTLEAVIKARQTAIDASGIADQAMAENMLTGALKQLFALSEAYPDLKANQNFLSLQEELTSTENKVSFSRQHYNRSVSQYNEAIQVMPNNMVAGLFGFKERDFFEIEEPAQREAPKVEF